MHVNRRFYRSRRSYDSNERESSYLEKLDYHLDWIPYGQEIATDIMKEPLPSEERSIIWTALHGHYALNSGFAMDTSSNSDFLLGNCTQLTLTGEGLMRMAREELSSIPDIS
jgi:hypothetical protein